MLCVQEPNGAGTTVLEPFGESLPGEIEAVEDRFAYLTLDACEWVCEGDGIRIRCRSRTGEHLVATVRKIMASHVDSSVRVRVELVLDSGGVADHISTLLRQEGPCSVLVEGRYRVATDGDGVVVRLNGALLAEEVRTLRTCTTAALKGVHSSGINLFVDARRLMACPTESLGELRRWLSDFMLHDPLRGVVLTHRHVTALQLRRLARESETASSLATFRDDHEAIEFWEILQAA